MFLTVLLSDFYQFVWYVFYSLPFVQSIIVYLCDVMSAEIQRVFDMLSVPFVFPFDLLLSPMRMLEL